MGPPLSVGITECKPRRRPLATSATRDPHRLETSGLRRWPLATSATRDRHRVESVLDIQTSDLPGV